MVTFTTAGVAQPGKQIAKGKLALKPLHSVERRLQYVSPATLDEVGWLLEGKGGEVKRRAIQRSPPSGDGAGSHDDPNRDNDTCDGATHNDVDDGDHEHDHNTCDGGTHNEDDHGNDHDHDDDGHHHHHDDGDSNDDVDDDHDKGEWEFEGRTFSSKRCSCSKTYNAANQIYTEARQEEDPGIRICSDCGLVETHGRTPDGGPWPPHVADWIPEPDGYGGVHLVAANDINKGARIPYLGIQISKAQADHLCRIGHGQWLFGATKQAIIDGEFTPCASGHLFNTGISNAKTWRALMGPDVEFVPGKRNNIVRKRGIWLATSTPVAQGAEGLLSYGSVRTTNDALGLTVPEPTESVLLAKTEGFPRLGCSGQWAQLADFEVVPIEDLHSRIQQLQADTGANFVCHRYGIYDNFTEISTQSIPVTRIVRGSVVHWQVCDSDGTSQIDEPVANVPLATWLTLAPQLRVFLKDNWHNRSLHRPLRPDGQPTKGFVTADGTTQRQQPATTVKRKVRPGQAVATLAPSRTTESASQLWTSPSAQKVKRNSGTAAHDSQFDTPAAFQLGNNPADSLRRCFVDATNKLRNALVTYYAQSGSLTAKERGMLMGLFNTALCSIFNDLREGKTTKSRYDEHNDRFMQMLGLLTKRFGEHDHIELVRFLVGCSSNPFAPGTPKACDKRAHGSAVEADPKLQTMMYNLCVVVISLATGSEWIPPDGQRAEWKQSIISLLVRLTDTLSPLVGEIVMVGEEQLEEERADLSNALAQSRELNQVSSSDMQNLRTEFNNQRQRRKRSGRALFGLPPEKRRRGAPGIRQLCKEHRKHLRVDKVFNQPAAVTPLLDHLQLLPRSTKCNRMRRRSSSLVLVVDKRPRDIITHLQRVLQDANVSLDQVNWEKTRSWVTHDCAVFMLSGLRHQIVNEANTEFPSWHWDLATDQNSRCLTRREQLFQELLAGKLLFEKK